MEQDLSNVSAEHLDARCAITATAFPTWPKILSAKDLSKQAAEQPEENQWWIAEQAAEEGGEGKYSLLSSTHLIQPAAPRRSARANKGKGPLPPDSSVAKPSAKPRGKKRSAATAAHSPDDEMDVDEVDPSPREVTTPVQPVVPTVTIQSPPHARAVQRRKVNEGTAVDVAPQPVAAAVPPPPVVPPPAPVSEALWVARDMVSIILHVCPPLTT